MLRWILVVFFVSVASIDGTENDFVDVGVRLIGDHSDSLIADLIATEKDIHNAGHIRGLDLYHFRIRRQTGRRSKRAIDQTIEDLRRDERIEFVMIAEELEREKRELPSRRRVEYASISKAQSLIMTFDDDLYPQQWYLENEGQLNTPAKHDLNIVPAWLAGYSGSNVTICIVDDGVDHSHPDLIDNYKPQYSYDLNDLKEDAAPRTEVAGNNHGTRCAGAAAGKANNGICGVGVAFNANTAGIRLLDGRVTTLLEARALTMFAAETDIKSASWGPPDDGTKMESPGSMVNTALEYGVNHGRGGKGTLFVWAAGNGGNNGDDCGADGYTSHPNVISIGSLNHLSKTTYFDERCPSTMAMVHTGGLHSPSGNEKRLAIGVVTVDIDGKCTTGFFGTSSAAPVAAGALALVLEANPLLTYRDVMYIIAETARIPTLDETEGWTINGAGYHVNDRFGFGVLDVGQMIAVAQNWTNVQPRKQCYKEYTSGPVDLEIESSVEVSIDIKECPGVNRLEHVTANVSFVFHRRGDVKITLISPSHTSSELLSYRDNDATPKGIEYFPFTSVHHWGESPIGQWTLRVETRRPQTRESLKSAKEEPTGALKHFGLLFYGSFAEEETKHRPGSNTFAFTPNDDELRTIYNLELSLRQSPHLMQKRDYQNLLKERQVREETRENSSRFERFRKFFTF